MKLFLSTGDTGHPHMTTKDHFNTTIWEAAYLHSVYLIKKISPLNMKPVLETLLPKSAASGIILQLKTED